MSERRTAGQYHLRQRMG